MVIYSMINGTKVVYLDFDVHRNVTINFMQPRSIIIITIILKKWIMTAWELNL